MDTDLYTAKLEREMNAKRALTFANGLYHFATAFRVDDPESEGWKQWVCGMCVSEQEATDPSKMAGQHRCGKCGQCYGEPNAFERADELLSRICPVAARQRSERMALIVECGDSDDPL